MLSITSAQKTKIINDLLENVIKIEFTQNQNIDTITEENIVDESMALKQSICDSNSLKLGGCIASEFDIQLMNTEERSFGTNLVGQWIEVTITQYYLTGNTAYPSSSVYPGDHTYPTEEIASKSWKIFEGYIDSATRQKDNRNIYKIVAYDPITKLFEKDISNRTKKKLKTGAATAATLIPLCVSSEMYNSPDIATADTANIILRNEEFEYNNEKTTKGDLLRNICEVLGGYGFYRASQSKIRLCGLSTFQNFQGTESYSFYEDLSYEDINTSSVKGFLFSYAGEITQYQRGSGSNPAYFGLYAANSNSTETDEQLAEIDDNFNEDYYGYYDTTDNILIWDYSNTDYSNSGGANDLGAIKRIYRALKPIINNELGYRPLTATVDGRLWVEPGDTITFTIPKTNVYGEYLDSNNEVVDNINDAATTIITSRVFSRKITGIKALTDEIEAKGVV